MQVNRPSLRILHVITSLDPAAGGPPNVLLRLAAAQAALGHSVATLSYGGAGIADRVAKDLANVPQSSRVENIYLERVGFIERRFSLAARAKCDELVARFDIVHLHGVWDSVLRYAATAASKHRVPYMIAPHGMLDPWSLSQKKLKKRIALVLMYRRMLNRAAALHLLNADEESLLAPLRLTARKVILPNGIYLDEINPLPEPGSFRKAHPALGDRPYVLFLGRLHFKKGLDYLAAAFAELAGKMLEIDLVVAGPDDGEGTNFQRAIAEAGLGARVHLVGPLYGRRKIEAFADAAVFCLPSRQEGFSVAIVEAMACGVPVVISRACHFPEVQGAGAGIITELRPLEIAGALGRVLSDQATRDAMGVAGRSLVSGKYTWASIAAKSIEIYYDLRGDVACGARREM
ncbi:MAG: glycosyltransferase [Burkholderiales bacterium]|nr:glycosyltransferase [Phycisphaerae bacterium]